MREQLTGAEERVAEQLAKGAPEVGKILAEVKRLESEGYEFEAAEGSFELLVRRQLGLVGRLFNGGMYALAGYLAGRYDRPLESLADFAAGISR